MREIMLLPNWQAIRQVRLGNGHAILHFGGGGGGVERELIINRNYLEVK
jgi:hypothetical protein